MIQGTWHEVAHCAGMALMFVFMLCFCAGGIMLSAVKSRRKRFYFSPVGWQVKYWEGEESRTGTVVDATEDNVTIRGIGEPVKRGYEEVNPLYKHI